MNKLTGIVLLAACALYGVDGYEVYKKNCMACHAEMMSKEEVLKNLGKLKAPPMVEVAKRLRENIVIADDDDDVKRFVTIAFIKEYLQKPSVDYSMCHAMAIEKFGIMPAQKQLNEAERQAVAEWILDRYEETNF